MSGNIIENVREVGLSKMNNVDRERFKREVCNHCERAIGKKNDSGNCIVAGWEPPFCEWYEKLKRL